jgi:hypothetical protein
MAQNNHRADDKPFLKVKLAEHYTSPNFSCTNCPVDHGGRVCAKAAEKKTAFDFDFSKLNPMLQQRFMDLASTYEKAKYQKVNKHLNSLIKPAEFKIINELIAHANNHYPADNVFWGIRGYKSHVHPLHEEHLQQLKDVVVNKKFNGVFLPDKWLTQALSQNVTFYLKVLHIDNSKLTGDEFKALCDYGTLESIFIENVIVEPPPKAYELAMYTTQIKKFHINIKNFQCEANWIKSFAQFSDKRSIRLFEFRNVSPVFNALELDKFIRTRMITTKEKKNHEEQTQNQEESTCEIAFDQKFIRQLTKKGFEKKLDKIVNGVFKRVPKVQYEQFKSYDRFMVDGRREEKSGKHYFFVNCRAIDNVLKEAEEQKLRKEFHALRVKDGHSFFNIKE